MSGFLKKKLLKIIIPLCILCTIFALGLFFGLNSWDKNLYVQWSPSKGRRVAGEGSSAEILSLSSDQLIQKASSTLFSKNQIIREDNKMAFYLGNFLAPDPNLKEHRFICQIFSLVEFSFSAIGINFSGEEGLMVIQSPCNMESTDLLGPFWIPHQEILVHPDRKSFELPEQETFIRFYNVSIILTDSWFLKSVRFFNESSEDNEFLVRFTPGSENPYFELSLKTVEPIDETTIL